MEEVNPFCYTFSALSNDTQLFNNPQPTSGPLRPETEASLNFPGPIGLRAFEKHLADHYGMGKSIEIWTIETPTSRGTEARDETHGTHHEQQKAQPPPRVEHLEHHKHHAHHEAEPHSGQQPHSDSAGAQGGTKGMGGQSDQGTGGSQGAGAQETKPKLQFVAPDRIIAADLSEWKYRPAPGKVAVDPVRGRMVFPPGHEPEAVVVSYYYGFSADMGGGEYHRPLLQPMISQLFRVGKQLGPSDGYTTLLDALKAWNDWKGQNPEPHHGIIEIVDNEVYTEQLATIELEERESLQIRAANRTRPVIRLVDWRENLPDSLKVKGERGSRFTLDGLFITGRAVQIEGNVTGVHIRHSTLVPGWGLHNDCEPHRPAEPGLELFNEGECVTIEHSIIGSILVYENEVQEEPIRITISDSILDATSTERSALSEPEDGIAYAALTVARCTVFGQIRVHAIERAENSIFRGLITVARRQWGCTRFCYITPGSRTPRRYRCQPDLVEQAADAKKKAQAASSQEKKDYKRHEEDRVRPVFNSTRYGNPTYCQLALVCAVEITHGADDESEMGAFHDLYQPQRQANLRVRLDDYTPAGMEAGIIYVS
jgi:hypothetical protein